MSFTFTDELPEGTARRRTKADEIVDACVQNEGKWALVRSYDNVEAGKVNAKATDVRGYLRKVAASSEEPLQYEVRTPGAGTVQGFMRFPTQEQAAAGGFDSNEND